MSQVTTTRRVSRFSKIPTSVWGVFIIVPSLFLLYHGAMAWSAAVQFKTPIVMTFAEFQKASPHTGWYTITDCYVDVSKSVYWEQGGVCIDVFAPLESTSNHGRGTSSIYIEVDDRATLSTFQDMTYARKNNGPTGAQQFIQQHLNTFIQKRNVSGLVSYGHSDPIGEWSKAGLDAATTTFIADRWKRDPVFGYVGTGLGLAFTILSITLMVKGFLRR